MENIYKKYRKLSGMTQEKSAEHIGISVDSLKRFEMGERVPSNLIASKMCLLYGDMRLAYDHLCYSEVGELILKELDERDLCCSVLAFINSLNANIKNREIIIRIASDGKIDESEKEDWLKIENGVQKLVKSCFELVLRRE